MATAGETRLIPLKRKNYQNPTRTQPLISLLPIRVWVWVGVVVGLVVATRCAQSVSPQTWGRRSQPRGKAHLAVPMVRASARQSRHWPSISSPGTQDLAGPVGLRQSGPRSHTLSSCLPLSATRSARCALQPLQRPQRQRAWTKASEYRRTRSNSLGGLRMGGISTLRPGSMLVR
eukprot:scaffold3187_cov361-Prasinococcus_capsulatus_cf.AAC.11